MERHPRGLPRILAGALGLGLSCGLHAFCDTCNMVDGELDVRATPVDAVPSILDRELARVTANRRGAHEAATCKGPLVTSKTLVCSMPHARQSQRLEDALRTPPQSTRDSVTCGSKRRSSTKLLTSCQTQRCRALSSTRGSEFVRPPRGELATSTLNEFAGVQYFGKRNRHLSLGTLDERPQRWARFHNAPRCRCLRLHRQPHDTHIRRALTSLRMLFLFLKTPFQQTFVLVCL